MGRRQRQSATCAWAPRRGLTAIIGIAAFLDCGPVLAVDMAERLPSLAGLRDNHEIIGLSLIVGLVLFSTITALLHLTGRRHWTRRETALTTELAAVRARLDRAETFLAVEPQITVVWTNAAADPEIDGDLSIATDVPIPRRLLGFGSWLAAPLAQSLDGCVDRLRQRGEAFRLALENIGGRHLEIEGRPIGGRAVMRIRNVSGDRLEVVRLRETHARVLAALEADRALLDALPSPSWARDRDGKLTWVSASYARAIEAKDAADAITRGTELLEAPVREAAAEARAGNLVFKDKAPLVVAGERRLFDIVEVPTEGGAVGIAQDVSNVETLRSDLARLGESHARTLDQLSTAVAVFDRSQRLVFHNAAYRQLWALDQTFIDQAPREPQILDHLRVAGLLPEQADFRAWKESLFAAYRSPDTSEQVWHLPDGRTLRTVVNPNPQGGVTYLFDDVTERFRLESQFNALTHVQGETLDTLREGVAVFGSDGRLKLFNPAFTAMWKFDPAVLTGKPHIDRVAKFWRQSCSDEESFAALRNLVSGLADQRTGYARRLVCLDGSVLDSVAAPLPDGATLLTFTDVTASVNVERALKESNQALLDAEKLRNDFVHHVSYELRSPLTNIIGFTQLLNDGTVGPLNERQREYAGYVSKSSAALLAIINDILDLASIDTDAMELSLGPVDVAATMQAAAEGVQDRLAEQSIRLQVLPMDGLGSFIADAKRIRQILFNLLSNAIGFSAPGQTVVLAALRRGDEIVFKVSDAGRGIPQEVVEHVFDRFSTHTVGSRHRGVGLGLSIVKSFVELHGGRITIDSVPGEGTTVTCIFPAPGVKVDRARTA